MNGRSLCAVLALALLAGPVTARAALASPQAPDTNLVTLTKVSEVRRLSAHEAARGYPVKLLGVVTFSDDDFYLHFVQDDTAGIYFDLSKMKNRPPFHAGQRVEITGFSGPGDYAPVIVCQAVRVLGEASLPNPEHVSFGKLMTGNFDSQWVVLKGVVRNQLTETNLTTLELFSGDGLVKVRVHEGPKMAGTAGLVDAGVAVRGVCTTTFDDRRRLQGVELQVSGWSEVEIKEAPADDPFKLALRNVSDLFQFHAGGAEQHRAHLSGTVSLVLPDGSFYLQDSSGGMLVQPKRSSSPPRPGTVVDAAGFPLIVDQLATLQDALVQPVNSLGRLEPVALAPAQAIEEALQGTWVTLRGEILGHFSHGPQELLTLRFGQRMVDVVLEKRGHGDQLADWSAGTVIQLKGVFLGQFDPTGKLQGFRLLLKSPGDLQVISTPGWWSVQHTLWALAGVAVILLLALSWVRALRRQVRQRTRELHEEIEHHKRTEAKLEQEIAERKRMQSEVERTHQELLTASRQAGMAEVATSVLHNVGNVLNSVNVSTSVLSEKIRKSKTSNLARAAEMIDAHTPDLAHFLTADPKGRQLPQYFRGLAKHLDQEQAGILAELDSLRKNVEHIKGIVVMQQNYAKIFGSAEPVKPAELVEDALRMHSGALVRHEVRVIREFASDLPEVVVDKHKLLQILVNLISNAKKACDESPKPEKLLTVRLANKSGLLRISVIDNGVGIPPENLTRIFNHGFTTRKDGHGFGLHSGALAAKEMGGALLVESEGPDKGSAFTIELPIETPKPETRNSKEASV